MSKLIGIIVVIALVPAPAFANGTLTPKAKHLRVQVIKTHGKRAPGRDIIRYGLRNGKKPSNHQKAKYIRQLRSILNPPPSRAVVLIPPTRLPAGVASVGLLPSCADESAGNYSTGPANTNPSGATGRWQEMPMHRQPGGLCYGLDLSPSGQDRCASIIYAHQGAGAWTACG